MNKHAVRKMCVTVTRRQANTVLHKEIRHGDPKDLGGGSAERLSCATGPTTNCTEGRGYKAQAKGEHSCYAKLVRSCPKRDR